MTRRDVGSLSVYDTLSIEEQNEAQKWIHNTFGPSKFKTHGEYSDAMNQYFEDKYGSQFDGTNKNPFWDEQVEPPSVSQIKGYENGKVNSEVHPQIIDFLNAKGLTNQNHDLGNINAEAYEGKIFNRDDVTGKMQHMKSLGDEFTRIGQQFMNHPEVKKTSDEYYALQAQPYTTEVADQLNNHPYVAQVINPGGGDRGMYSISELAGLLQDPQYALGGHVQGDFDLNKLNDIMSRFLDKHPVGE